MRPVFCEGAVSGELVQRQMPFVREVWAGPTVVLTSSLGAVLVL